MLNKRTFLKLVVVLLLINGAIILIVNICNEADVADVYSDELMLDKREAPSEEEIYRSIQRELPSLPVEFYLRHRNAALKKNDTCAPFAKLFHLQHHNDYWQTFKNDNVTYQLFGAYYDKRASLERGPAVRVLAMINQIGKEFPLSYCQLWFDEFNEPIILPVTEHRSIWNYYRYGIWYPFMMACIMPEFLSHLIPKTVSLVAEECALASNNLKVFFEEPATGESKRGFAVCVKGLDFPYADMSARWVEWLELMRILGADKVIAYEMQNHANNTKVLRHYEKSGFVEMISISMARGDPALGNFHHMSLKMDETNKRLNELIPYNDCFYRNMYKYDYIAVVDMDEVLMPRGNLTSWHDIAETAKAYSNDNCPNYASLCFRNVYFPRDQDPYSSSVPEYLYMLQHVRRTKNHSDLGSATKCLHNTEYVRTLHNHYAVDYEKSCFALELDIELAQMQHYREPDVKQSEEPVEDASIWRFKEELVQRTTAVFRELGFFRKLNLTELRHKRKPDFK